MKKDHSIGSGTGEPISVVYLCFFPDGWRMPQLALQILVKDTNPFIMHHVHVCGDEKTAQVYFDNHNDGVTLSISQDATQIARLMEEQEILESWNTRRPVAEVAVNGSDCGLTVMSEEEFADMCCEYDEQPKIIDIADIDKKFSV